MLRECTTTELVDEIERLRAENERLRTALANIRTYRSEAQGGSGDRDRCPWYALGRIDAEAGITLLGWEAYDREAQAEMASASERTREKR